jgi:PEP-CTERM motif
MREVHSTWGRVALGVLVAVFVLGGIGATAGLADNYGVIFSGGGNKDNNHDRYYEETLRMWNIMTGTLSYDMDKVFVLFSDGTDTAIDRSSNVNSDWSMITAAGGNISSATPTDLSDLLATLDQTIRPGEDCFHFWSFDHGGNPTWDDDPVTAATEDAGYLVGWGGNIQDEEFAAWVLDIDGKAESYAFGQCFAGDMADDLNILPSENRFATWAADWTEPSYGKGWVDAWADGIEGGLRLTHELGNYAINNDPYLGSEHPGWIGANFDIVTNSIPEPGTLVLVGLGAGLLAFGSRRRKK